MYPNSSNNNLLSTFGSDRLTSLSLPNPVSTTNYTSTNKNITDGYNYYPSASLPSSSFSSSTAPRVTGSSSTTNFSSSMVPPLPTLAANNVSYTSPFFPVSSTALRPTSFLHALASTPSIPYGLTSRTATLPGTTTSVSSVPPPPQRYPLTVSSSSTSTVPSSSILYKPLDYGTSLSTNAVTSKLSIGNQQLLSRFPRYSSEPSSQGGNVLQELIEDARQSIQLPPTAHKSDYVSAVLLDKHSIFLNPQTEGKQRQGSSSVSTYTVKTTKVAKEKEKGTTSNERDVSTLQHETNISADISLENQLGERSRSSSVSSTVLDTNMDNLLSSEANDTNEKTKNLSASSSSTEVKRRESVSSESSVSSTQLILNLPSPVVASFRRVVAARENSLRQNFSSQETELRRKYEFELKERMEIAEISLNDLTDAFNQRIQALEQRQQTMERGRADNLAANEAQFHAIEQENIHLRTRLMELQTDLSKANMLRAQSETTLHDTVNYRDAAEQTVRTLTTRIEELLRVMENDRRHATNLQETINKLQSEISTTNQAVTNEHTEVERLRGRCAGLEASEATLRKQLEEVATMAAGDTGRLQREIVRLSTALADANVTVATKEQELAGVNDRIGRLSGKLTTEQEAHLRGREAWEKEREEINTAIARMRGNWQVEREEASTALATARAAWEHEKEEITIAATAAREEAAKRSATELAEVLKVHTAESSARLAKEKALTSQIQEFSIIAETESAAAKRISTELSAAKERIRTMEMDTENMKTQCRIVADERDRIMTQLTHTENEYKRALTSASEAHEARLTAALETAAADRAREVGLVQHEISSLRHSLNTAETELETVRAELDKEREHSAVVLNDAHAEVGRITERLRMASETSTAALRAQWDHEKQRIEKDNEAMITALQSELKESANRAQHRLTEEHERYTKLSAMYDGANERIRDVKSEALMLRQTIAEHRTELAHERAERHADATKYEKEITQLNNSISDQDIRIRTLTTEISQLSTSLTEERNEKERYIKEFDNLNRTHRETVDYATKLEQVVDEARSRLVAFERTVTEMKEARDTDVHALQEALTEARSTIGELTSSLEQQRSLLTTERDISNHLRSELTTANERELDARTFATNETGRASRLQSEANQATLNLQTALASAVTDLEHRVELVASLEAHTTELKAALEDARARAEKFSSEARIAAAEAAHSQAETATARTSGEILSRTLEETRAELAALHKAHNESLNDIRELRTALGSREGECAALTRRLESAIKEGEGHMRAIDKMNTERTRLEEELNNSRRDTSTAQSAVVTARLEVEKAQAEATNAQHRTEALRAEVSVLLDRAERSETSMKMAQQARADAESRAAELGREAAEARRSLGATTAELQEAHNAIERLRIAEKKVKDEVETLRAEAVKGRPDVDRLRGDLERTRMENDRVHDELRATKGENERIRADAARHAIQEDKYRKEASNLHVETERAKGEAERYRAEAERARTEIERLRTEYATSISGDGRMRLEMDRLRVTVSENEGIITGLRDRVRTLMDEARDYSARMIAMESQVRDSQELLRIKNAEARNYEKDIAKHRSRNEEMEAELRSLRGDLKTAREETAHTTLTLRDTGRALEEALRAVDLERQASTEIRHHAGSTVAEATRVRREAEVKAVEAVAAADAELDSVTARAAERIADVTRTAEERIILATRRADEAQQELATKETQVAKLTEMISEYGSGMNTLRETLGLTVINTPLNNSTFINTDLVTSMVNKGNIQSLSSDIRRNIRELTDFVTVLRRKSMSGGGTEGSLNKSNVPLNDVQSVQPWSTSIADVLNNSTNSIRSLRLAVQGNVNNNTENIPPMNGRMNSTKDSSINNNTNSSFGTTSKSFSIFGIRPLPTEAVISTKNKATVTTTSSSAANSLRSTPLRNNSSINGIQGWKVNDLTKPSTSAIIKEQESMQRNDTPSFPPPNDSLTDTIPTYSQLDDSQVSTTEETTAIESVVKVQTSVQKLQNSVLTTTDGKINGTNGEDIVIPYASSPGKGSTYEPSKYITVYEPTVSSTNSTSSSPSGSRIFVRVRPDDDKAPLPVVEPTPRTDTSDNAFGSSTMMNALPPLPSSMNEPLIATALESAFPSRSGVRRGGGRRTVAFTNDKDPNNSSVSLDPGKNETHFPSLPSFRSTSSVRESVTDSLNSSMISSRPPSAMALTTGTINNSVNLSSSLAVLDTATVSQLIGDSRRSKEMEQRAEVAEMEAHRVRYAAEKALQVMSNPAILGTTSTLSIPLSSSTSVTNPMMSDFNNALGKAMELASKVKPPSTTVSSRASSNISNNSSANASFSRNGAGSMAIGSNVSSTAFTAILPHSSIVPSSSTSSKSSSTGNSTSASPARGPVITIDNGNITDKLNTSNNSVPSASTSRPVPRPLVHFDELDEEMPPRNFE